MVDHIIWFLVGAAAVLVGHAVYDNWKGGR